MKLLIIVSFFLNLFTVTLCQRAFGELNTFRYTRTVSCGNAFTGLTDRIEMVYYNSAGIANLNFYYFFADSYLTISNLFGVDEEVTGSSIDMSIAALDLFYQIQYLRLLSETRFGIQLQNLFSSNLSYSNYLN